MNDSPTQPDQAEPESPHSDYVVSAAEVQLLDAAVAGFRSRTADTQILATQLGVQRPAGPVATSDALALNSLSAVSRLHHSVSQGAHNTTTTSDLSAAQLNEPPNSTAVGEPEWELAACLRSADEWDADLTWFFQNYHARLPRSSVSPFLAKLRQAPDAAFPVDVTFDGADDIAQEAARANSYTALHFGPNDTEIEALLKDPVATFNYPKSTSSARLEQWWLSFFTRNMEAATFCAIALLELPRAAALVRSTSLLAAARIKGVSQKIFDAANDCNDSTVNALMCRVDHMRGSDYGLDAISRVVENVDGSLQWKKRVNKTEEDKTRLLLKSATHVRELISWADWLTAYPPEELAPLMGRLAAPWEAALPWQHLQDSVTAAQGDGRRMPAQYLPFVRSPESQACETLDQLAAKALLERQDNTALYKHLTRGGVWTPALTEWVLENRDIVLQLKPQKSSVKNESRGTIAEYLLGFGDAMVLSQHEDTIQHIAQEAGAPTPTSRIRLARIAQHFQPRTDHILFI